ncbi:hypothetical protein BG015_005826 [Linnemannia schmuckeri]|uniref:Uncharacterized protein n=1 Tax=Linnemannia schmuckeri TaxID=64567 RepID=A0A9P5S351_9FUNG|nr:hypothetical protein BG015_005826 [Linnemannia schmuckeri]
MNLASFPIGLGLTAAAHVYLSNLCWRKTAKYQRRYLSHHRPYKAHILSLALHDLETLSSFIILLDANIENMEQLLQEYSGRPPKSELRSISVEELRQWIESYSLFRSERGNMIRSVAQEMMRTGDIYVDLRTNQVCTYLLSTVIALRYVLSTEPAAPFMIKHFPRLYRFGSWIAQGLGVNSSAAHPSTQISSQTSNLHSSRGDAWGSLLFQLAPTLFLSGIHFIAGLRCQWVIRRIQQDRERQLLFVKRVCFVSMILSLRHSRLEWLLQMSEACEEFQNRREASGDYSEVDQAEIDAARQPSRGPQRPSTHNQLRVLAKDPESHVYALLNDPHDGLLFEYMPYSIGNSTNRPSPLRSREFSFGPDLERVDTAQYLGDPRERLRIIRLEYMAMKTELELFRELFVIPKKNA